MKLENKIVIISRKRITDDRGWFLKAINGKEENLPEKTGEFYFTQGLPGKAKGGHYHVAATEWFTLISGQCLLRLRDMDTGEEMEIELQDTDPRTIVVPPNVAHIFVNRSECDFILAAYSSHLYDPSDTVNVNFL